jgi:hypothetical protein
MYSDWMPYTHCERTKENFITPLIRDITQKPPHIHLVWAYTPSTISSYQNEDEANISFSTNI